MKKIVSIILLITSLFAQQKDDYLIRYEDGSYFGYKNKEGKIIIPAKYLVAEDIFYKTAFVYEDGWKLIDRKENILLIPFIYDNGPDYVVEGVFRFVENKKMGFATPEGRIVIPAKFDFVTPFENKIAQYHIGGYKEYTPDKEHWFWTGSKEIGYINLFGEKVDLKEEMRRK